MGVTVELQTHLPIQDNSISLKLPVNVLSQKTSGWSTKICHYSQIFIIHTITFVLHCADSSVAINIWFSQLYAQKHGGWVSGYCWHKVLVHLLFEGDLS